MARPTEISLSSAARFGYGWDGYNAERPRRTAISDARRYLEHRIDAEFRVECEPDGSINLVEGEGQDRKIHAFEGDGVCTTMVRSTGWWEIGNTLAL